MGYLKFDIDQCIDCYACLRACPVKAIKFTNNKAEIMEDKCILCGQCVNVCPHNAKNIISTLSNIERLLINNPGKVVLSVAPSFITNFDVPNFTTLKNACLKLGFVDVQENAYGAALVDQNYLSTINQMERRVMISTACPAAVDYVRKMYPEAIKYLAPIDSPMIAHAKLIKYQHPDYKVVYVGTCIAKKKEAALSRVVDGVLTYEELDEMLKKNHIEFEEANGDDEVNIIERYYPINRGTIKALHHRLDTDIDCISIDGGDEIDDILDNIESLDDCFIEMYMCKGGCVNGPCKLSSRSAMKDNTIVRDFVKRKPAIRKEFDVDISLHKEFTPIKNEIKIPTEEEMQKILNHLSRYTKEDEINCGACGYKTCRDKAIAVFNGLSDPEFCLPHLKNKAESFANEIMLHTPNGIITVDKDGIILDVNHTATKYLKLDHNSKGHFYGEFFDLPELLECLEKETNLNSTIVYEPEKNMYFDVSITYVKSSQVAFAIYKDVTKETLNDEEMKKLRQEMVEVTDSVINKQMAAVQEIASLLGESTASAKIALVNFKNSLKDE